MGYLASAEEGHSRTRGEVLRQYNLPTGEPDAPDCPIWRIMRGVGLYGHGAMGRVPITAVELSAWAGGIGAVLTEWEFQTVLDMSRAFIAGQGETRAPNEPDLVQSALLGAEMRKQFAEIRGGR